MQRIEIVVRPGCLGAVREALRRMKVGPFRLSNVAIFESVAGPAGSYRGQSYVVPQERVKLELTVPEHEVEPTVVAVRAEVAALGKGDAEFFVLAVRDSLVPASSPRVTSNASR
ncbi:MAG TPA: P-II family nitrogen regulator [Myxococcota bacterium]|jgi:nitrogen regulatory protein PII|nr:P-II family nitrogen regulator [Myxococcota bacterium]